MGMATYSKVIVEVPLLMLEKCVLRELLEKFAEDCSMSVNTLEAQGLRVASARVRTNLFQLRSFFCAQP